ncbi:TetR/AcrR family transcriptional regulator [Paenibacillus sp. NPDC057934]|uniref:TetR/AcrR family transcriptional regulator n=1 Tax=Paenibacillus sp. NPDC057934 TaxID=3346282 RepID=UPI0036DEB632
MKDRRSIRTKKVIRNAFLELLNDKDINKITVAEISRIADLGRGTFYLHYKDVYDLYEQIENDLFEQLSQFYNASFPSNDPVDLLLFMEKTTEYIYDNKLLITLLFHPGRNLLTLQKFKDFFHIKISEELRANMPTDHPISEYDEVETTFTVCGVVGVLEKWVSRGMEQSPKQISHLIHLILMKIED